MPTGRPRATECLAAQFGMSILLFLMSMRFVSSLNFGQKGWIQTQHPGEFFSFQTWAMCWGRITSTFVFIQKSSIMVRPLYIFHTFRIENKYIQFFLHCQPRYSFLKVNFLSEKGKQMRLEQSNLKVSSFCSVFHSNMKVHNLQTDKIIFHQMQLLI